MPHLSITLREVAPSTPPELPEIGRTVIATYSLHRGAAPPPRNFATLAIGIREVLVAEVESPQGDPLPVLFI